MEQNEFENLINERKAKVEASIKHRMKNQWVMAMFLMVASLAMVGCGAYLLSVGGYVLGAVLLALGIGVGATVSVLHVKVIKKMKKRLDEISSLGVKK